MTLSRSKVAITLLFVAVIGIVALATWAYASRNQTASDNQATDYSPATKEDKGFNDAHKKELGTDATEQAPSDTATTNGTKQKVTPVITAHGQPEGPGTDLKLNGFVPGIIEDNGVCTLTLTREAKNVTVSKTALQNAQDTSCGQLTMTFAEIGSKGIWSAVLSYDSPSSSGLSKITQIEIK